MRTFWITAALAATLSLGGFRMVTAADCGCDAGAACGCNAGYGGGGVGGNGGYGDPCDPGNGGCRGILCRNRGPRYDGMQAGFNCGCNGSYKFPVPPLYTYHWPGMWQQNLMTDYHSPWRFPPLKPYTDEVPEGSMGLTSQRRVQQAAALVETPASTPRSSFSSHVEAMLR